MKEYPLESFEERIINYTIEVDRQLYLIEHVPARVCLDTGEQSFSPETVERIQDIIERQPIPSRIVETPVYDFAA
ncbi:MAG: YgiT-type zinc finger protein [Candidatus Methylumidiphilus sp.]